MDEIKQAVVVRADLRMGVGKTAAQVGHACVMGAEHVRRSRREWFDAWRESGQAKIVLRVADPRDLEQIRAHAADARLPFCIITDAGRTQVSPGTVTCLSIGPAPAVMIDRITGGLKLL